ncbi:Tfp pilus assembly protein FimT/FimU, partial [Patescibacteria group bacterium]
MKIVKNNKGFTLIEIMTVIVFMGIITGLIMANINTGKHIQILKQAADELVQDIRTIQGYATGGKETGICAGLYSFDCLTDAECTASGLGPWCGSVYPECELPMECGEVPKGGYGIEIQSPLGYALYADTYVCMDSITPNCADITEPNGQDRWYEPGGAGSFDDPSSPLRSVTLIPP